MKIGKISYLNAQPFFTTTDSKLIIKEGHPRELSQLAHKGDIDAGPLPLVDCWDLADFEDLYPWGIAVQNQSRSVFVLSKIPFKDINNATIAVTHESSTSVALLKVLINLKYQHQVNLKRGFNENDQARLVIGDQALAYWDHPSSQWPFMVDLATEWWQWKRLPFVFAKWIVRKTIATGQKKDLATYLENSVLNLPDSISKISLRSENQGSLPREKLIDYLNGFTYKLGEQEKKAMGKFQLLYNSIKEIPVHA